MPTGFGPEPDGSSFASLRSWVGAAARRLPFGFLAPPPRPSPDGNPAAWSGLAAAQARLLLPWCWGPRLPRKSKSKPQPVLSILLQPWGWSLLNPLACTTRERRGCAWGKKSPRLIDRRRERGKELLPLGARGRRPLRAVAPGLRAVILPAAQHLQRRGVGTRALVHPTPEL